MWNRRELKEEGKAALKRNYWKAVLVSALSVTVIGGTCAATSMPQSAETQQKIVEYRNTVSNFSASDILLLLGALALILIVMIVCSTLVKAIFMNPLEVGIDKFKINAIADKGNISDLGEGFDVKYKRNVATLFLRDIYIALWLCLFIIPGIIKLYEYAMIPYLLADNPNMSRKEAFTQSKAMMKGNKWRAFVLDLSFILWHLLGVITCGIVTIFYVLPYEQLTTAALYKALKK